MKVRGCPSKGFSRCAAGAFRAIVLLRRDTPVAADAEDGPMNDYQMTHLARDRFSTMRAEADRQRLARTARPEPAPGDRRSTPSRRRRLGLLFGRAVA